MSNIREENYDIICKRIQELIDELEQGHSSLTQEQWKDIVSRITKLNKILEQLGQ